LAQRTSGDFLPNEKKHVMEVEGAKVILEVLSEIK
jgi:hypothetical protein